MIGVSDNFRRLELSEVASVASATEAAWQDPSIPLKQWALARIEIERLKFGHRLPLFEALRRTFQRMEPFIKTPSLLEVGAASAYYSEIIPLLGFACDYHATDYSSTCEKLAHELYPHVPFFIDDASNLQCLDESFEIVLSGCVIIHTLNYAKVIEESARVASKYVVMNRTPLVLRGSTQFFQKDAYGVPCLEIHFEEQELMNIFEACGLKMVSKELIFANKADNYAQATYLLKKS